MLTLTHAIIGNFIVNADGSIEGTYTPKNASYQGTIAISKPFERTDVGVCFQCPEFLPSEELSWCGLRETAIVYYCEWEKLLIRGDCVFLLNFDEDKYQIIILKLSEGQFASVLNSALAMAVQRGKDLY
jgi:hypothetical protein